MSEVLTKEQKLNQCFFNYVGFLNHLAESRDKTKESSRYNEREILASFRESIRTGSSVELLKYVQKYLDELPSELSDYEREKIEEVYLLIAGLFGIHPSPTWKLKEKYTNLGRSLLDYERKFNKDRAKDDSKMSSTEKRLMLLLRATDEDLPEYLRQTIQLLKSQEISINWLQLLRDIRNWNNEKINVQRNWAKGFWGNTNTKTEEKGEEK